MSAYPTAAPSGPLTDDAMIELARTSESRHLARVGTTGLLAGLFACVAFAALLLPAHRDLSAEAVVVSVACYALASRVQFEFAGYVAIPTQGVLVAMWFLLPPRALPLVVGCAMVAGALPEVLRGRVPADRLALSVVASWHSVGPALVLYLAGALQPQWSDAGIYVAAFAAQVAFDVAATYLVTRPVVRVSVGEQLRASLPSIGVDAMLGPLGLLVSFETHRRPAALLLLLPVLFLFATFARERQQRIDKALELTAAYRGTALLLGDVIEADDAYTGSHSRDVVDLVVEVADRLGLDARERQQAELAALLHDVGKVKIPSELINKAGPLDAEERALMDTHTLVGERMLDTVGGLLAEVGRVVRSCHERWDGGGYPDRLRGEEIPLPARIVCACDAWSAMTTDRSYRKALPEEEALAELRRCAGTHFDPRVVDALLAVLAR